MFITIDDHPKLRAPVPEVIVGDGFVAEEPKYLGNRIADNGRSDVSNVHGLGDVWGGEVDDVGFRVCNSRDGQTIGIGMGFHKALGEPCGRQPEVHVPLTSDRDRLADVGKVNFGNDFFSDRQRGISQFLLQRHGHVGLVIGQVGFPRSDDAFECGV